MDHDERGGAWRYGILAGLTTLVALAGYLGYVLYPRFDLPAAEGASLLALAAAAGVASFFSPCAFPLLVTLLARESAPRSDDGSRRRSPAWILAGALAIGATAFLLLVGLGIAAGAGAAFASVTFTSTAGRTLRGIAALVLLLLGLIQLGVLPALFRPVDETVRPLLRIQARQRRRQPVLGFGIFGFGYLLAGFG